MEKKPFVGQMDRQVEIIERTLIKTTSGFEVGTDIPVCQTFAFMEDLSGGEVEEGKVIALMNRTYTIRYRSDIKDKRNTLLLIDGNLRFEVNNTIEIGRKSHLKLICKIYE